MKTNAATFKYGHSRIHCELGLGHSVFIVEYFNYDNN